MKPAPFDYVAPESVDAAVDQLARAAGDAAILAGGQTLMPLLALRMATPTVVVDINRIAGLAGVSRIDGGTRIGALTRQAAILADPIVAAFAPGLKEVTSYVGHHQTRNRGTIGGSISLADPAAEYPATALALGAQIEARSPAGSRRIEADDFFLGAYTTALEADEMVTALHFPDWPAGTLSVVREVALRPGDFALVGLVCALAIDAGKVTRAGIAWLAMGPGPVRSRLAEQALVGQDVDRLDLRAAAELAVSETDPMDDGHATAAYRRTVAARIFQRSLGEALNGRSEA
jgi:aerobic carbon-monoxide dehydrogenase medium subunit